MILSLVCGLALHATDTVADFFPLVPGTVRTYESKSGDNVELVDKVGDAMDMGGPKAYPVTESAAGHTATTTYYRVDSDQIVIVANDLKHPLPTPMPILKIGDKKTEWDISGATMVGPAGERLIGRGDSHPAGQRTVLGKKVDVIEVRLNYEVGSGLTGVVFDQHAVYARGIGLVEISTKTRMGKKQQGETSYHLVRIDPPKGGFSG